jgi:hypothetical protein
VGGDFNILRFSFEKNKNYHPNRFSDTFNVIIQVNELTISGGIYTWSNNHSDPTLEKLDRILMSREWELLFPTIKGHKEPRGMSDHNLLIIYTQQISSGGKREFKFDLSWRKQSEFLHKINEIWNEPTRDVVALDRVLFKLKKVKRFLKGWEFNLDGSRRKRKKEIMDKLTTLETLEEMCSLNQDQIRIKVDGNAELMQIPKEEELYWFKTIHEN